MKENKIAKNVASPKNEEKYINAYKNLNSSANKKDNLDIAAVKTKGGIYGHALVKQEINRGKDNDYHHVIDFIDDNTLKKTMNKK